MKMLLRMKMMKDSPEEENDDNEDALEDESDDNEDILEDDDSENALEDENDNEDVKALDLLMKVFLAP